MKNKIFIGTNEEEKLSREEKTVLRKQEKNDNIAAFKKYNISTEANESLLGDEKEKLKQMKIGKPNEPPKQNIVLEKVDTDNLSNTSAFMKARQRCKQKADTKSKGRLRKDTKGNTKQQSSQKRANKLISANTKSSDPSVNTDTAFKSWREEGLNEEERRHRKFGTAVKNTKAIIKSRQRKFSEITCKKEVKASSSDHQESKVDPVSNTFSFNFDV